MERLVTIMEKIGLPFAYHHFAEGESPDPPFICFLTSGSDNFAADGRDYFKINQINIELYTDRKLCMDIIKDGYLRIALEVFMRIVQNRKAAEKHYRRIKEYAPKTGVVRMLRLTEKHYDNITMITGEPDYQ